MMVYLKYTYSMGEECTFKICKKLSVGYSHHRLYHLSWYMSALTELTFISGLFLIIAQMFFLINLLCFLVLDENGEESEEPPVPVVKEIKEKDAFYSKKYATSHHSIFKQTHHLFLLYLIFQNDLSTGVSCFIRRMESLRRRGSEHCIWRWWLRANFSF